MVRCVNQTFWGDYAPKDVDADCWRGALASLLGLPIREVPHFIALYRERWHEELTKWLRGRGLMAIYLVFHKPDKSIAQAISDVPCLVGFGEGFGNPDNETRHTVVMKGEQVIHDPCPITEASWFTGEKDTVCLVTWIVPYAPYYEVDSSTLNKERLDRTAKETWQLWNAYLGPKSEASQTQPDTQPAEKSDPDGSGNYTKVAQELHTTRGGEGESRAEREP